MATPFPSRAKSASRRALRAATGTGPAGEPACAATMAGRIRRARSARLRRIEDLELGRDREGVRADLRLGGWESVTPSPPGPLPATPSPPGPLPATPSPPGPLPLS